MKKIYRYILLFAFLIFLGYHSVYFERLSERQVQGVPETDFVAMADSLYHQGILRLEAVIPLPELLAEIRTRPDAAFETWGNRLGIGNSAYFFVHTAGKISAYDNGQLRLTTESSPSVNIDTKYIFGNALRDASSLVQLTDFKTNAQFNLLSEALNDLVREKILPPLAETLTVGDSILVKGAIRLSRKAPDPSHINIIPAQIILQ